MPTSISLVASAALISLILTGCATARLNQINNFSQAGITYVAASQTVISNAGSAAVNADSAQLVHVRGELTEAERRTRLIQRDELLKQRLLVLQLIGDHGKLLQAYFQALASLSDAKGGNSVGSAAQSAYDALAKLSPALKNARMGTTAVSDFIPTVTAPAVAVFKAHALNDELKKRASAVTDELALQEAAFAAIRSEFTTDAKVQQNYQEVDNVNQFVSAKDLPPTWSSQRLALLSTPSAIASADSAAKAASELRNAFVAAVADRLDSAGFATLMGDISNMLTLAQTIQSATK